MRYYQVLSDFYPTLLLTWKFDREAQFIHRLRFFAALLHWYAMMYLLV
jgi:hypothetical protein